MRSAANVTQAVISLNNGSLHADIQPWFGGRLLALYDKLQDHRIDWIEPATPATQQTPSHVKAGCFPMVPYCNRIRDGHLRFDGIDYDIGWTHPWPEACHGQGFLVPWSIVSCDLNTLSIAYGYDGGDWPAPYWATQRFLLRERTLEIELSVTNVGDRPMPGGIGFHPYFPDRSRLQLKLEGEIYRPFDAGVRSECVSFGPFHSPPTLPPGKATFLSCWNGRASMTWAGTKEILEVAASPSLSFCTLFATEETDLLCIEPSSHAVGGLNMLDTGDNTSVRILGAGESLTGSMALRCSSSTLHERR